MQTEDLKDQDTQKTVEETAQEIPTNTVSAENGVDEAVDFSDNEKTTEGGSSLNDEKDSKIEELQNRILRLQADFDNFRRRNTAEREQLATFVIADVVGKFLKVLDNFERAEVAVQKSEDAASITAGLEMIRRQFEQTFKDIGVEEIKADGVKFDPELHEAVMRGQNPELEDDTVETVFEKGYKLRDKVIRYSKVKVIKNE